MDLLKPPEWLTESLPEGGREFLENGGWWGILGFGALVVILLFWAVGSKFMSLFRSPPSPPPEENRGEVLADYPPLPPSTGDRRLLVEGVPVRLRLVVLAPAGREATVDGQKMEKILDQVLSGMGDIALHDKPRLLIWPGQLSYEGFANTVHRSTILPEGEDQPSSWVIVAGRALAGKQQIMLGLGLQALRPTTVGRRTLQPHEWASVLRVRVRD